MPGYTDGRSGCTAQHPRHLLLEASFRPHGQPIEQLKQVVALREGEVAQDEDAYLRGSCEMGNP